MIELKNVSKTYKSKKGNNTKALDNVTLKFDNAGMTFILGKSGSGKSTLLNIIGGLSSAFVLITYDLFYKLLFFNKLRIVNCITYHNIFHHNIQYKLY